MSEIIASLGRVINAEIGVINGVSNNIANLSTPGFRAEKSIISSQTFSDLMAGTIGNHVDRYVDSSAGSLRVSEKSTDIAISGDGWFMVDVDGKIMLTRDGRLQVKAGVLSDINGNAIIADGGKLDGLPNDFDISPSGEILVDGKPIGKIRIASPMTTEGIKPAGNGLYTYDGELKDTTSGTIKINAFENSNVNTTDDMLSTIRSTRHIETIQRAISAYDQLLGSGINQIGK